MRKTPYALAVIGLFMAVLAAACSSAAPPTAAPAPAIPQTGAQSNSQPAAAPTAAPAQPNNPATAPLCQANAGCQAPDATQAQIGCVKKVPYTNISVPPGTTFEVLDKSGSYVCVDSGRTVNGKEILTCRGPELMSFQLKLNGSSCSGANLATGTGQCQQGYGYDASQQCCAPLTGGGGGANVITVDLQGCPLPHP